MERLPEIIKPDGLLNVDIYYNDTFATDFELYRNLPRLQAIIDMLPEAAVPADHPKLGYYEFSEWRRLMVEAYHGACPAKEPVRFITRDYVEAFTRDAVSLIEEIYGDVFGTETA